MLQYQLEQLLVTTGTTHKSLFISVGNTPLLKIDGISPALKRVDLYAKAEWLNPGGSVKDRPALHIIQEAERDGRLSPGKTLLDATSGNTGIAYSWICARLGYPVLLAVPRSINPERRAILESYGARLILTDPLEGSDGAIREARRLAAERPELYFYADQYNNQANWRAHFDGTAREIIEQVDGEVTHFVAGLGTGGTFVGTGRRLREHNPKVRLISVEPDGPLHGLEGLKHMESSLVPGIYDPALADRKLSVSTEEARALARRLARENGLLVGPSGAANLAAALRAAEGVAAEGAGGTVVTVFPDSGERYLSERFWREEG